MRRAQALQTTASRSPRAGGWKAVLALLVLVFQVLAPISPPAALAGDGLFPPACHDSTGAADVPDGNPDSCADHCRLCQVSSDQRGLPVLAAATVVLSLPVQVAIAVPPRTDLGAVAACIPPLPSRGPPSVA